MTLLAKSIHYCSRRVEGCPAIPSSSSVTQRRDGPNTKERTESNTIEEEGGGRVDLRLIGNVASVFHQPEEWLEWN
ncbi:hypothetical protein CEXT_29701 [Caerostris extrusa]|uniref:Uncharacterized protein n=1 Tax=Caerostris extrusa TaxID=172846 RepID=A0AAV4U5W3_CAEEX|nr:hypothetical protein CEXT_29701 [Caerostris extrusa]